MCTEWIFQAVKSTLRRFVCALTVADLCSDTLLSAVFQHPDEKRLEGLSKQLDWDVRTIQRWFRQRRNQEKPSTLARFCESMWESAVLRNLGFVRAWFVTVLQDAYCSDICQVIGTFFFKTAWKCIKSKFYFHNMMHLCETGYSLRKDVGRDLNWLDAEKWTLLIKINHVVEK